MEIVIDKKKYKIEEQLKGSLIYQYVSEKGKDLPCFCYSEPLSVAGNCRMCLVEVEGAPKLLASCAVPISSGMSILTESSRLSKARESILELLLINHPLDCPVCDQGGECDLQDLTFKYGSDRGRYYEYVKRAVVDKEAGVFIKTIMTRCIHCTRCVRFFSEIAGSKDFGILGRGESSEITMIENLLNPLSGNVVDVCPVGALTSKPYAFTARPWELTTIESIDIFDSMGSSIRVDLSLNKILRVLPVNDKELNEDWITNKARYFFDLLNYQRLTYPFFVVNNNISKLSWKKSIYFFLIFLFKFIIKNNNVVCYNNNFIDLNTGSVMNLFFNKFGLFNKKNLCNDFRSNYVLNNNLDFIFSSEFIFFLGIDLRLDMPLLNTRVRKLSILRKTKLFSFGLSNIDVSLNVLNVGNSIYNLLNFLKGNNKFLWSNILNEKFSLNMFKLKKNFYFLVNKLFDKKFLSFLNTKNLGYFDLFINNFKELSIKECNIIQYKQKIESLKNFIIFFGDSVDYKINETNLNFYFGSFYNKSIKKMDFVLPVTLPQEKDNIFLNFLGKKKFMKRLVKSSTSSIKNELDILNISSWVLKKFFINTFNYLPKNIYQFFNKSILNYKKFYDFILIDFIKGLYSINITNNIFLSNNLLTKNILNYYKSDLLIQKSSVILNAGNRQFNSLKIFIN